MAAINKPQKGSSVNGTKKNDKIDIINREIENLVINANSGNDVINVKNGEHKTTVKTGNGTNTLNLIDTTGVVAVTGGSGADTISICGLDEENRKITSIGGSYSINADNGNNKLNINSTGNFNISTGKNNDTFNIQGGDKDSVKTFKAGAGTNTFNIYNSKDLGKITIAEQSVKAKNTIDFKSGISNIKMTRNGNNLVFSWNNSTLDLKNYYAVNKKYATWTFKIKGKTYSYANLLKSAGSLSIKNVKGTIPTSAYNDIVYLNQNMGKTTIANSKGSDTVVFNNLTNEEEFNETVKLSRSNNNLIIKYSDTDTLTLKDYFINKTYSIKKLQAGSYSVDFKTFYSDYIQSHGGLNLTVSGSLASVAATDNSETINAVNAYYKKDKKTTTGITIKALGGDDTIKATKYDDKIYGGKGNDTINAGKGKNSLYFNKGDGIDTVVNGGGTDTLIFTNVNKIEAAYDTEGNLVVKYGENDYVILKDYEKGHSVKYIKLGTNTAKIPNLIRKDVIVETIVVKHEEKSSEEIVVPANPDTSKYEITGDTIKFKIDANLKYIRDMANNDLAVKFSSDTKNNSVILKDYFTQETHNINKIEIGSNTYVISDEIQKGLTILGTNSKDVINGLNGKNVIFGYDGDDEIHGQNDIDEIYGEDGADTIYGQGGNDKIKGGNGADTIYGGDGEDSLQGGSGNDTIYGGSDNDIIYGNEDDDTIYGDEGDDVIYGNDGNDIIYGGEGNNIIYGGKGNDEIHTDDGSADIYFSTGDGIDTIYGAAKSAILYFEQNTKVSYALEYDKNENKYLAINYGNSGDKVIIPDYNPLDNPVKWYYVGAIRYNIDENDLEDNQNIVAANFSAQEITQQVASWNTANNEQGALDSYINENNMAETNIYAQFTSGSNIE